MALKEPWKLTNSVDPDPFSEVTASDQVRFLSEIVPCSHLVDGHVSARTYHYFAEFVFVLNIIGYLGIDEMSV